MHIIKSDQNGITFQVTDYVTMDSQLMYAVTTGRATKTPIRSLSYDYEKVILECFKFAIALNIAAEIKFAIVYELTNFPFVVAREKIYDEHDRHDYWNQYNDDKIMIVALNENSSHPIEVKSMSLLRYRYLCH